MISFSMLLFCLVCFTAATIQSLCGFGFGVFAMCVFPYFIPYTYGLVLVSAFSIVISVIIISKYRKHIIFKALLPLIIGNVIAVTSIMSIWDGKASPMLTKSLGVVLILLSIYFLFLKNSIKVKPTFLTGLTAGIMGGCGNALFYGWTSYCGLSLGCYR